jgi:type I restriction enzyme M protein
MMREFKIEDFNPIAGLTRQVWSLFDILRSHSVSPEDYTLVLFLISLSKDGYLDGIRDFQSDNYKDAILSSLNGIGGNNYEEYLKIYDVFESCISSISDDAYFAIYRTLDSLDKDILKSNFEEVFDSTLYQIAKSQGRHGGEFIQPIEITRFINSLAELPDNAKVFNPFAGVASFGIDLNKSQHYFAQEINSRTWAIGLLRLMAYNRLESSIYTVDDSIAHWPSVNQKFDLIVSNPPYGIRLNNHGLPTPNNVTIEQFLIESGLNSLTNTGKLITIFPNGFLFRRTIEEQRLRLDLVEQGLIDTIISLPGGLLLNTGIPLVIIVFNFERKRKGSIRFIDARDCVETIGREKRLNDYALNSLIKSEKDSDSIRIVTKDQIEKNNYELNVNRYFQKEYTGIKLGEIIEPIRTTRNTAKSGRLVRIRDLKENPLDCKLEEKSIEVIELRRPDIRVLEQNALLLATRWRTLKPTAFFYKGESIFHSQDITAFKINENKVNLQYLINELHADYVIEQLDVYRVGDTIPSIRREDLLEIKIKLPSLQEQLAKVQGLEELSSKFKTLQEERNKLVHGQSNARFNEFASLKHTLGRPRQNILDWSDNILDFIKRKKSEFETLNKSFADFYDIDLEGALNEIKRDIDFISLVLEKGENGLILSDYPLQLIPLSDINALINNLTHNGFKFKLKKIFLISEGTKDRGIECNSLLFKTLIDNILTNADKYGYTKKDKANEVVIELTEVDDQLIMELRNNGLPFKNNFDKDKFISKHSTSNENLGSGLGGYDINRIAEYFNNPDWELILNEDPIYPVKFKFQFPVKFIR